MPRLTLAEAMYQNKSFMVAEAGNNQMPNVVVGGGSHDYDKVISLNIVHGRYFTHSESAAGSAVAIVGHDIAMQLFGRHDAVGETMKLKGIRVEIIGVLAQEGESIVSTGLDEFALVPSAFSPRICDVRNADDAQLAIKAKPGVALAAAKRIDATLAKRPQRPSWSGRRFLGEPHGHAHWNFGHHLFQPRVGGRVHCDVRHPGRLLQHRQHHVCVRSRTNQDHWRPKGARRENATILIQFLFEAVALCVFGAIMALVAIQLLVVGQRLDVGSRQCVRAACCSPWASPWSGSPRAWPRHGWPRGCHLWRPCGPTDRLRSRTPTRFARSMATGLVLWRRPRQACLGCRWSLRRG